MPKCIAIIFLLAITLFAPYRIAAQTQYSQTIDIMLGQKQILDIRFFCSDGTPSDLCKTPVTSVPEVLAKLIAEQKIGGVILFAENLQSVAQVQSLTGQLQTIAKDAGLPKLFIAIDQEGGRVSRLPAGVGNAFAGNMAIGATYNEHKTQFSTAINQVIAEQLLSLGINVNFAPSVDVNINPLNPVINVRSYGSSAGKVAELGIAAVEALQTTGVISAMKHFPGHGDTHVDSHTGLPIVAHTRNQIDAIDVFPFAQAIDAGGRASPAMIMTAHIQYPELDAKQFIANDGKSTIVPATLSRKILTDVLRNELNYQGLIVTDALDMAGIAHYMDESQAMLQTFYAGADIALMPYAIRNPNDISEYQRLLDEVTATILTQADKTTATIPSIDEMRVSTVRILATKKKYLDQASANLDDTLSNKERSVIAADKLEIGLAKAALTSVLGPTKMDLQKSQVVGLVMPDNARCEAFVFAMQQQDFEQVRCLSLAKSSPNKQLIQFVDNIDTLILGDISPQHSIAEMGGMDDFVSGQKRAGKQQQYSHIQVLLETAKCQDKQRVFVALRTPYIIERFKALIDAAVVTYDYRVSIDKKTVRGVMFDVLAEWLAGEFEAKGQLPVTIGAAKQRHSTQQLD